MGQPEKFTCDEMAQAITDARGLVSLVAKRLGCEQQTVRNYIKRYATCKQALEDARESLKDFTESQLLKQIDGGNIAGIIFFLKTQARDRGYIERQEITGADGGAIQLKWSDADD